MTVRKLLKRKGDFVSVVSPDALIQSVMDQLEQDEVSALVVSGDGRAILGIVAHSDVVRGLNRHGPKVVDRPVREIMTEEVFSCDASEPMSKIYELMDEHRIRHIPITKDGELCGIINMLDVVKYRLEEIAAEADALKEYVGGRVR